MFCLIHHFFLSIKYVYRVYISFYFLWLYLSDIHIGAKVDGELYENNWNEQELNNRLDSIVNNVASFGNFDTITIAMLGDHLDGMDQMTSRRDHTLPQNQVLTFSWQCL